MTYSYESKLESDSPQKLRYTKDCKLQHCVLLLWWC
jgi:hypothetical protein